MPSLMEMLRMANIFGPQSQQAQIPELNNPEFMPATRQPFENISFGPSQPMEMNQMNPDYDVASRMQQIYNPSTAAGDRYEGLIDAYPERPENQGMLRKIASIGLASLSDLFGNKQGQQTFQGMMYPGHEQKLADWKTKIGPAQSAANLERQENVNSRTLAHQTVTNEIRAKADEDKVRKNEADLKIRQQRADIYEFKAKNPHMKLMTTKGGNITAFNPLTGQTIDTGVPSGSLSEMDKLNFMQEDALERIGATGEETRETEGTRQVNREKNIALQGEESRKTKGTPSASTIAPDKRTELPTQTKVRQFNKASEIANSDPDLGKFVKLGKSNDFEITKPGSGGFFGSAGPTKQQYDQIVEKIYGTKGSERTGKMDSSADTNKRNQAIKILQDNGKPVTPANIEYITKQLK